MQTSRIPHVLLIGILAILAISFVGRLIEKSRLEAEISQWQARNAQLQQHQLALQAELQYVRSDAYAQKVAHDELGMSLPDEAVIVVIHQTPTPTLTPPPQIDERKGSNFVWPQWLERLFD